MKKNSASKKKEKKISDLLCEPSLEIEVYENVPFDAFHEFVYRQVDLVALISAFNAVLLKQEWLTDFRDGYLPVTSRKYSEGYLRGVKIKEVKHGSLFLSIVAGVASGLILMLIQETYKKMHSDEQSALPQININFDNCNIVLDRNQVDVLPADSVTRNALRINLESGLNELDAKAFIKGILEEVDIDDDLEGSIRRCIDVLHREKIISVSPSYDSKGMRALVNSAGRFIDYRI